MGHLKYPLFQDSIDNYEKLEKYRERINHHVSPHYLDVYAKKLREIRYIFKVIPTFMLCSSSGHGH